MDGWTEGWIDGWMDGWIDGWMEGGVKGFILVGCENTHIVDMNTLARSQHRHIHTESAALYASIAEASTLLLRETRRKERKNKGGWRNGRVLGTRIGRHTLAQGGEGEEERRKEKRRSVRLGRRCEDTVDTGTDPSVAYPREFCQ